MNHSFLSRLTLLLTSLLAANVLRAWEPTRGYNNAVPEEIMTPDSVETRIGTMRFFDSMVIRSWAFKSL